MATKAKAPLEPRKIMVFTKDNSFVITIPGESKTTFGPWSPPTYGMNKYGDKHSGHNSGTLRVYGKTKEHILAVIPYCTGFRDLSLGYMEVDRGIVESQLQEEELATGITAYEALAPMASLKKTVL